MNSNLLPLDEAEDSSADVIAEVIPTLYTGPPPLGPTPYAPSIPSANILAQSIIASTDKLFFLSIPIGSRDTREWRLVRVALEASMSSNSSCFVDGRCFVDYYICHPSNSRYSAINQHYWLRYHHPDDLRNPTTSTDSHLLRLSVTAESYARRHNLLPYRSYINLTHADTYIYGPFNFATIHGRKSRNWVCQAQLDILKLHCNMFTNPIPRFDIPSYSVHVDRGVHTVYHCKDRAMDLVSWAKCPDHGPSSPLHP